MHTRTLLLAAVAALSLTACDAAVEQLTEEAAERAAEAAGAGDAEIDLDEDGGVSLETDEGSLQIGTGGELPDDFPSDIPLPDDYAVAASTAFSDETGQAFQVTLEAPGLDVTGFVEDEVVPGLESAGYEIVSQSTTTSGDVTFSNVAAENASSSVNVAAQEQADGEPIVTIQVFPAG